MSFRKCTLPVFATLWMIPAVASAQIHQVGSSGSVDKRVIVNFSVGRFALQGLNSRPTEDILFRDLQPPQPLLFNISDLNSVPVGGEFLYRVAPHIEVGAGVTYGARTAHSVYANLTHPDGSEIMQDLKLSQLSESFTGRYLFLPPGSTFEPYAGGGVIAIRYKYSEIGEFVDLNDLKTFPASYEAKGTVAGPLLVFGARARLADRFVVGGEGRWQHAVADVPAEAGFLGTKLSLTGWSANFTFGVRF